MLHAINTGSVSGGKTARPEGGHCGLMDTAEYDNRVAAAMGGGGGDEGGGGSGGSPQFTPVCVSLSRWPCERPRFRLELEMF